MLARKLGKKSKKVRLVKRKLIGLVHCEAYLFQCVLQVFSFCTAGDGENWATDEVSKRKDFSFLALEGCAKMQAY